MRKELRHRWFERRWTTKLFCLLMLFISQFLIFSCSETKNLAEGEVLYTGIKRVSYDKMPKPEQEKGDTTGVITALGNAYNTVSDYLTGTIDESPKSKELDKPLAVNPSPLTLNPKKNREAYATAKSEVEGVLAYKPNNSLMGSSYYRQPLAVGLWTYNKYLYSKKRFGKWIFNTFAATPVTLTTVNPRVRTQVAQNTLRNYGYFRGQVSFDTIPQKHPRKGCLRGASWRTFPFGQHCLFEFSPEGRFPDTQQHALDGAASERPLQRTQPRRGTQTPERCIPQ